MMKFAEKVRAARLNMGYTQKQLAEKTRVALRTIVSYEKGDSYPRRKEKPTQPLQMPSMLKQITS